MALPVVFIHRGNSWYLPYTLTQAKIYNPNNAVYLLGDKENSIYRGIVSHRNYSDYFQRANELALVYVHHSSQGHDYELFCLQRWMILLEFMYAENHEQVVYLDSDILSYCDYEAVIPHLPEGLEMSVVLPSGHTNFVLSRDRLAHFCQFIMNGYTGPMADMVRAMWLQNAAVSDDNFRQNISDMTFLLYYHLEWPHLVYDLSAPFNGVLLDRTLDNDQGMVKENGIKKLSFENGEPYAFTQDGGQKVRMLNLHFQGASKTLLTSYLQNWSKADYKKLRYYNLMYQLYRVQQKIKNLLHI